MDLPLSKKELEIIIQTLKGPHPQLYAKLWSYKMNYLSKEKKDGFS
jgi:hypothetical protein